MMSSSTRSGLVVLISGTGSNLLAILKSKLSSQVLAVISDNQNAKGIHIAQQYNKPVHIIFDVENELSPIISQYNPALIVLAGFMTVLSAKFIRNYPYIINIHPSLLPSFRGLNTHQRVLEAGEKKHGCSVHWVDEGIDTGEIIAQRSIDINKDDTVDSLSKRVHTEEHLLYPQTLAQLLKVS